MCAYTNDQQANNLVNELKLLSMDVCVTEVAIKKEIPDCLDQLTTQK